MTIICKRDGVYSQEINRLLSNANRVITLLSLLLIIIGTARI